MCILGLGVLAFHESTTCALGLGAPGEGEGGDGEQGEGCEVGRIAGHEVGGGDELVFDALKLEAENGVHDDIGRPGRRREGEQDARAAATGIEVRHGKADERQKRAAEQGVQPKAHGHEGQTPGQDRIHVVGEGHGQHEGDDGDVDGRQKPPLQPGTRMLGEGVQPEHPRQREEDHGAEHLGGKRAAAHAREHVQRVGRVPQMRGRGDKAHHGHHQRQAGPLVQAPRRLAARLSGQHRQPHDEIGHRARGGERREEHEGDFAEGEGEAVHGVP